MTKKVLLRKHQGLYSQHFFSLYLTNGPNKLECFTLKSPSRVA
jgi:hypothetical protein